jgi:hypothetical protein
VYGIGLKYSKIIGKKTNNDVLFIWIDRRGDTGGGGEVEEE